MKPDNGDLEHSLDCYLKKCELQYRADHMAGAGTLDWLAPHCGTVKEITAFLREIGFRIKEVVDEETDLGSYKWVVTTSGVIVYVNTDNCDHGLFAKECKR